MIDLTPHMPDIARALLGPENPLHSTSKQLRWGTNGSLAVELDGSGRWYDQEHQIGGGPWQLLYIKGRMANGAAIEWLHDRLGLNVDTDKTQARKRIVAAYDYRDQAGNLLYQAVRFAPKGFKQRRPDGKGGWIWSLGGVRRVPYRLPELIATSINDTVYIVEGEKDVDRLHSLGLPATCNSQGAGKWRPIFSEFFKARDVVVLPDNDDTGRQHAQAVAANLTPVAQRIRVLELPDLPPKGDVSDWFDAGGTREKLELLVASAPASTATSSSTPAAADWMAELQQDSRGEPRPNLVNAMLALRGDPKLSNIVAYDEMLRAPVLSQPVPGVKIDMSDFTPRPVRDADVTAIEEYLQVAGIEKIGKDVVHQAVDLRAQENAFHPLRDYLDALRWDGDARVDAWLSNYLGAETTDYHSAIGRMFLIAMVARVYAPGCKCDYMLVLEGRKAP